MNSTLSQSVNRCLWFRRGEWRLAVPMEHLQEVIPLDALHAIPAAEPMLAGFTVLRGDVLPVLDPALLVGSASIPLVLPASAIVLSVQDQPVFALVAEEIGQVVPLPTALPLSRPARFAAAFVGEARTDAQKRLLILDGPAIAAMMGLSLAAPAAVLEEA